jgi:hypothetical protein
MALKFGIEFVPKILTGNSQLMQSKQKTMGSATYG